MEEIIITEGNNYDRLIFCSNCHIPFFHDRKVLEKKVIGTFCCLICQLEYRKEHNFDNLKKTNCLMAIIQRRRNEHYANEKRL